MVCKRCRGSGHVVRLVASTQHVRQAVSSHDDELVRLNAMAQLARKSNMHSIVCGIRRSTAKEALNAAFKCRQVIAAMEAEGQHELAAELEYAFTRNLFIGPKSASFPIALEKMTNEDVQIWLYSTELGFYSSDLGRSWLVNDYDSRLHGPAGCITSGIQG